MNIMRRGLPVTAAILSLLFCAPNNPDDAGNSSQTGNPYISGRILNEDGTPAANAVVRFIPVSQMPGPGLPKTAGGEYSCVTDEDGRYGFDSLPDTLYNVFGEKGNGKCYRDSVHIIHQDSTHIPHDTLKAPGSLSGIVRLQPEHSSLTVLLLLPGTSTFIIPTDSIGHFTIPRMARGTYPVHIITTLDEYSPKDTFFTIRSGISDTLPDTINLQYTGVPVVRGVQAVLDSLRIAVTVSWNRADTALVAGYNVYRGNIDSTFGTLPINGTLVTDTFYVDENLVQKQGQTMVYKVKAVNNNSDMSKTLSTGAQVTIASNYKVVDSILYNDYPESISLDSKGDLFAQYQSIGDTLVKFAYGLKVPVKFPFSLAGVLGSGQAFTMDENDNFYTVWDNILRAFDSTGAFIRALDSNCWDNRAIVLKVKNNRLYELKVYSQEIKVINLQGDSITNWILNQGIIPEEQRFDDIAITDSFVIVKNALEVKFLDRSYGTVVSTLSQGVWLTSQFVNGVMYSAKIFAYNNNILFLNKAQARIYQITRDGNVVMCAESDPIAQISFDTWNFAVGIHNEIYWPLYGGAKILIVEKQ